MSEKENLLNARARIKSNSFADALRDLKGQEGVERVVSACQAKQQREALLAINEVIGDGDPVPVKEPAPAPVTAPVSEGLDLTEPEPEPETDSGYKSSFGNK